MDFEDSSPDSFCSSFSSSPNNPQHFHLSPSPVFSPVSSPVSCASCVGSSGSGCVVCPLCKSPYDSSFKVPLLLPSCGHTACKQCLFRIISISSIVRCPVCRSFNFQQKQDLPVNFALLEVLNCVASPIRCSVHDLEIVGYCLEDDLLMCGACIFLHKTHTIFKLTDPKLDSIALSKLSCLNNKASELEKEREEWRNTGIRLNNIFKEIEEEGNCHIRNLKQEKKAMMSGIKEGSNECVTEIRSLMSRISSLECQVSSSVNKIKAGLLKIKEKKENFDNLSMIEKIKEVRVDLEEIPSLEAAKVVKEKVLRRVDYREAIFKKKFE